MKYFKKCLIEKLISMMGPTVLGHGPDLGELCHLENAIYSYWMQITKREYISVTWRTLLRDFLWCQVLTVKVPKSNLLKLFFMVIHKKSRNLYSLFYIWNFLKLKSSHPFNPQISKIVLWSNRIWIKSWSDLCLVTTQDLL